MKQAADYTDLGNIAVHKGTPPDGNPYKGTSLMGNERSAALKAFLVDGKKGEYTFWFAPWAGSPKELHTAAEANVNPDTIAYCWGENGKNRIQS